MSIGKRLCREDDTHVSGAGTFTRNGFIYSSLVGTVKESTDEKNVSHCDPIHYDNKIYYLFL